MIPLSCSLVSQLTNQSASYTVMKQPTHPQTQWECCKTVDVEARPSCQARFHSQVGQEHIHLEDTSGQQLQQDWLGTRN